MSWSTLAIVLGIATIAGVYLWPQIQAWLKTASPTPTPTSDNAAWCLSTMQTLLQLQGRLQQKGFKEESHKLGEIVYPTFTKLEQPA